MANQNQSQKQEKPAGDVQPVKIKCRVLPGNRYGRNEAGALVEVDEKEYHLVKHCLITLDDEKRVAAESEKFTEEEEEKQREIESFQAAEREKFAQARAQARLNAIREAERIKAAAEAIVLPRAG